MLSSIQLLKCREKNNNQKCFMALDFLLESSFSCRLRKHETILLKHTYSNMKLPIKLISFEEVTYKKPTFN